MKPLADCRLYAFIDTAYFHGRAPEVFAQQLCDGGADLIQLRAKKSTPDEIRRMAEAILPVTRRANVGLVINDHPNIARETGAEFCHLGQEDFFDAGHTLVSQIQDAKSKTLIGLSTHSPEQAKRALAAGPDYIAIGPVYSTGTKPMAKPVTLEYVRWAVAKREHPVVRHRRHLFKKSRRCAGCGRKAHLCGVGNSKRDGRDEGLLGIPPPVGIGAWTSCPCPC